MEKSKKSMVPPTNSRPRSPHDQLGNAEKKWCGDDKTDEDPSNFDVEMASQSQGQLDDQSSVTASGSTLEQCEDAGSSQSCPMSTQSQEIGSSQETQGSTINMEAEAQTQTGLIESGSNDLAATSNSTPSTKDSEIANQDQGSTKRSKGASSEISSEGDGEDKSTFGPGLDQPPPMHTIIKLERADITKLDVDAIVNAANTRCLGGGGVDGAIHAAAGGGLYQECKKLPFIKGNQRCPTGHAVITGGYKLPAKCVIHTVGPTDQDPKMLESCYMKSLDLVEKHQLRSVAFPCISTGIYGYDNERAANVAIKAALDWLRKGSRASKISKIIFCVFLPVDRNLYEEIIPQYFEGWQMERSSLRSAGKRQDKLNTQRRCWK